MQRLQNITEIDCLFVAGCGAVCPPPFAKQTSPKRRGHLRAATRCYARPWFPTADLSKISFLVSRSSLGIRGANTSITSTIHLLIFLISSLHSLGFPNATDRAFCSQSSTLAPYFPHKSTKHRKTTTSMCNRLCMIMLFRCPIANKIQRSPFQNKPPLGTPASPPLCEAAFSWDPSQMIHRCLPESTFSHHASRKGGGFISSSTTFPTNLLAFLGRIQEILPPNRHYLVFAGNLVCFGDRLG